MSLPGVAQLQILRGGSSVSSPRGSWPEPGFLPTSPWGSRVRRSDGSGLERALTGAGWSLWVPEPGRGPDFDTPCYVGLGELLNLSGP